MWAPVSSARAGVVSGGQWLELRVKQKAKGQEEGRDYLKRPGEMSKLGSRCRNPGTREARADTAGTEEVMSSRTITCNRYSICRWLLWTLKCRTTGWGRRHPDG